MAFNGNGDKEQVIYGAGHLYVSALGVAEPATLSAAFVGWYPIGYTVGGTSFSFGQTSADVTVAEELDPIASVVTDRNVTATVAFAELSLRSLTLALNGGVASNTDVDGAAWEFEPPAPNTESRVQLAWRADDGSFGWFIRQCYQSGTISLGHVKGATITGVDTVWKGELPDSGSEIVKFVGSGTLNAVAPAITG